MAWRPDEFVTRGELDFTVRGRVSGRIWFAGLDEPVCLDLEGMPWADLAGHRLVFTNPSPRPGADLQGFSRTQHGKAGDMTASRKVRVPDCPFEEMMELANAGLPYPWHWANGLYLEWYGEANGRVVIESAVFSLQIEVVGAWELSAEDQAAQRETSSEAAQEYLGRLVGAPGEVSPEEVHGDDLEDEDEEEVISEVEKAADEESARMDLLGRRIQARIQQEGRFDAESFGRIMREERERLRRERGEPEPEPPTWEQIQEREERLEMIREAEREALREIEENPSAFAEHEDHPLVERCSDLAVRLHREAKGAGWMAEVSSSEHPLCELINGVQIAAAKLAGALNGCMRDEVWPPPEYAIGNTLVRLKKAREALRDAIAGARAARESALAPAPWLDQAGSEAAALLQEVRDMLTELRGGLE